MKIILLTVVLPTLILFFFLNLAARELMLKIQEKRRKAELEEALNESLRLDFTRESKTLKRVDVREPEARILCVDDEEVILDSFRKILVLDGYSVDTVETGQEALGLVQIHDYDFVFTDLKMPAMSGVDVAKSVKHLRPDIDVVVITGYASVDTAVECMKHGVVDYIEKPFTEDELRHFVKQSLIRRRDRLARQLKPRVHVMAAKESDQVNQQEFSIPGGVLVSNSHCWVSLSEDGTAKVGLDDFARKLLGIIDSVTMPNTGLKVAIGDALFSVNQGSRRAEFDAPISGRVVKINEELGKDCSVLESTPYGDNWVCVIKGDDLDVELAKLKIGKSAVALFQEDLDRFLKSVEVTEGNGLAHLSVGAIAELDDAQWHSTVKNFFGG